MLVQCNYPLFLNHLITKRCRFRVLFLHNSWGCPIRPGTQSTRPTWPIRPKNHLTRHWQRLAACLHPQNPRPVGWLTGLSMKTQFSTNPTRKYTGSRCSLPIRGFVGLILSDLSRSSEILSRSGLIFSRSAEISSRSHLISSRSNLISLRSAQISLRSSLISLRSTKISSRYGQIQQKLADFEKIQLISANSSNDSHILTPTRNR